MVVEKGLHKLRIDADFKGLISPLTQHELEQLTENICKDGCREPLVTWHGIIVDGHNRYEICHKYGVPFSYEDRDFDSRDEVISWICANQLGRRNISEETRRYLIGKRYESEKMLSYRRNNHGKNQYSDPESETLETEPASGENPSKRHRTAVVLGEQYHLSHGTVQKYAIYARAIDTIENKDPKFASQILSGRYKVSHENVVELSKLPAGDVKKLSRRMSSSPSPFVRFSSARQEIQENAERRKQEQFNGPSVKDMPEFDPDAEISSLTLTIPSWASSIQRARSNADPDAVSDRARNNLVAALRNLVKCIGDMLEDFEEEDDGTGLQ